MSPGGQVERRVRDIWLGIAPATRSVIEVAPGVSTTEAPATIAPARVVVDVARHARPYGRCICGWCALDFALRPGDAICEHEQKAYDNQHNRRNPYEAAEVPADGHQRDANYRDHEPKDLANASTHGLLSKCKVANAA